MDPYKKHFKKLKKNKTNSEAVLRSAVKIRKKKKKSPFPIMTIVNTIAIIAVMSYCLINMDKIQDQFSKVSLGFLSKSLAQSTSEQGKKNQDPNLEREENSPELRSELAAKKPASVKKDINYFRMLEKKEQVLDDKEKQLKKLESNLQIQREELVAKIKELQQMRADISNALKDKVDTDKGTVDKLVQVYANMKPKSAAKVLETMKEELAVKILQKMKKKNAAAILNVINAKRAENLTELIAGYEE